MARSSPIRGRRRGRTRSLPRPQAELMSAFNLSRPTVSRAFKRFRERGEDAFFEPLRRRGRTVVDAEMADQAAQLLASGVSGSLRSAARHPGEHLQREPTLAVDGHVKVYAGHSGRPPKHFVCAARSGCRSVAGTCGSAVQIPPNQHLPQLSVKMLSISPQIRQAAPISFRVYLRESHYNRR